MKPPQLRNRLAFDEPTPTDDGQGGSTEGWTEAFRVRGAVRYLRGGETVQASRLQGRQPVVITVRDNALIRAVPLTWRIRDLDEDAAYEINAAALTDNRNYREFTATSGTPK